MTGHTELLPCPFCGGRLGIPNGGHELDCYIMLLIRKSGGPEEFDAAWNRRAALSRPSTEVPGGFVLVPKEPTQEMLRAGSNSRGLREEDGDLYLLDANSESTWAAMIAASPQPHSSALEPALRELTDVAERYMRGEVAPVAHAIHKAKSLLCALEPAESERCLICNVGSTEKPLTEDLCEPCDKLLEKVCGIPDPKPICALAPAEVSQQAITRTAEEKQ